MAENEAAPETPQVQMRLLAQYVKDLSFENPNAPGSLQTRPDQPAIDVNFDIGVNKVAENQYEVSLRCNVSAKREDTAVFIVEGVYAGLFQIEGAPERALEPILLIECPTLLFPYLRRIISDATRDGGFMPLMLEPLDFARLYEQQLRSRQQSGGGIDGSPSPILN